MGSSGYITEFYGVETKRNNIHRPLNFQVHISRYMSKTVPLIRKRNENIHCYQNFLFFPHV